MGVKLQYVGTDADGLRDGDLVEVMGKTLVKGGDAVDFGDNVDADIVDRWSNNPHFKMTGKTKAPAAPTEPAA